MAATKTTTPQTKWDLAGWSKGKVTLFDALGIKGATYPQLTPKLAPLAASVAGPLQVNSQSSGAQSNPPPTGSGTGNLGGTSAIYGCSAAQTAGNQKLGRQLATSYGWGGGVQWTSLNELVMSESGWCQYAQNPSSTAYGIGQFLNGTWATMGGSKTSDPKTQIQLMLLYIKRTYQNPVNAWKFHQAHNYY